MTKEELNKYIAEAQQKSADARVEVLITNYAYYKRFTDDYGRAIDERSK